MNIKRSFSFVTQPAHEPYTDTPCTNLHVRPSCSCCCCCSWIYFKNVFRLLQTSVFLAPQSMLSSDSLIKCIKLQSLHKLRNDCVCKALLGHCASSDLAMPSVAIIHNHLTAQSCYLGLGFTE